MIRVLVDTNVYVSALVEGDALERRFSEDDIPAHRRGRPEVADAHAVQAEGGGAL